MRVFIYEHITAGGMGASVPASLLREGRAMLDAVVADFQRIPGVVVETLLIEAGFHELTASCDWTLVIAPEFDDLLANLAQTVIASGGRLLGPSPEAIRHTADKLHLANRWYDLGIRHPLSVRVDENVQPTIPPPWVLKPRHGAGSQATFLVNERAAWLAAARHEWPTGDLIIQAHIPGQPASVSLLIGPKQTIALASARQHLSDDGRFRYEGGSLPLPMPLAERAATLALQAVAGIDGLQGYVGVDLILGEDGLDYAIEINPRLTTSYIGLRQLCEQNLAELMLRVVQGLPTKTPAWKAGEVCFDSDGTIRRQNP